MCQILKYNILHLFDFSEVTISWKMTLKKQLAENRQPLKKRMGPPNLYKLWIMYKAIVDKMSKIITVINNYNYHVKVWDLFVVTKINNKSLKQ